MPVARCWNGLRKIPHTEREGEETHTPGITDTHTHSHTHTHTPRSLALTETLQCGDQKRCKLRWSDLAKAAGFQERRIGTWSGNVVFCWGYHCSSVCIGCILPWLLMLCRSTRLSSEWWTNGQWFSPRKSAVFHCFHVSSTFVYWPHVSSRCDTCNL